MTLLTNQGSTTPVRTGAIYALVERNGIWKLTSRTGQQFTARGRYNFVRIRGNYKVSKIGEHIHLSRGEAVEYAGEIRFGYNRSNRGMLKSWSNASGHYQPPASLALQAQLPMPLFQAVSDF